MRKVPKNIIGLLTQVTQWGQIGEEGKGKAKKGFKIHHLDIKEKIKQGKSFRGYSGWGGVAFIMGVFVKSLS